MGCSGYIVFPGHKRLVGVIEGAGLPGYDTQPVRSRLCNEACDVGLTGNFSIRQLGHVAGLHRLCIIRMVRTTPASCEASQSQAPPSFYERPASSDRKSVV